MNEADLKADRCKRADRQEEELVADLVKAGHVAYRIDKEIDVFAAKDGRIRLYDCKFTDNGLFYIDSSDVAKGLDSVIAMSVATMFKIPVTFHIDMYFPRHKSRNKKCIDIREDDRGWSIKVDRSEKGRFTTTRVKRGTNDRP